MHHPRIVPVQGDPHRRPQAVPGADGRSGSAGTYGTLTGERKSIIQFLPSQAHLPFREIHPGAAVSRIPRVQTRHRAELPFDPVRTCRNGMDPDFQRNEPFCRGLPQEKAQLQTTLRAPE